MEQASVEGQEKTTEQSAVDYAKELEEVRNQLDKLQGTNERLLGESKKYKSDYRTLISQRDESEKVELEKKEQWKDLLDREKATRLELEEENREMRSRNINKSYALEIAKHAHDANNISHVSAILEKSFTTDMVDDNDDVKGVAALVDELRKDSPTLFKTNVPSMDQRTPQYKQEKKKVSQSDLVNAAFKSLITKK